MKHVESGIAKFLTPEDANTQEYWNKHWPAIEMLPSTEAVLCERIFFYKKNYFDRNDALSLVLIADFAWQQIRNLAGVEGDDKNWLNRYVGDDYNDLKKERGFNLFDKDEELVKNLKWLFDIHSTLRHPSAENLKKHDFLLHDPWPKQQAERLLVTAESLERILSAFSDSFDESGWLDDIDRKSKLAERARMAHQQK